MKKKVKRIIKLAAKPINTISPSLWRRAVNRMRFFRYYLKYSSVLQSNSEFRRCALAAYYYEKKDIKKNWVLYESYNGRDFGCNPLAILSDLLKSPDHGHLRHFIAVDDEENPKAQRFAEDPRVTILKSHSKKFIEVAQRCKYYVNNASFKPYLIKGDDQVYVTTWHSTLLKKLAFDCGRPWESRNVSRALLSSDYFISPNRYTTELLLSSHRVDEWFNGKILETGYPRNDLVRSADPSKLRERLRVPSGGKLVLYAPTWRGNYEPRNTVEETLGVVKSLRKNLPENYVVITNFHTMVNRYLDDEALTYATPKDIDTNELLGAVDALITDYSGIFFDFLVTDKPIIYYVSDRERYEQEKKGFYLDLETLPGPLHENLDGVINDLRSLDTVSERYKEIYKEFKNRFVAKDDGCASERAIKCIFDGKDSPDCYDWSRNEKFGVLIYPANLAPNGVTESFLALLNNIDYEKVKVCVLLPNDKKYRYAQERINENATVLYQNVPDAFLRAEYSWHQVISRTGLHGGVRVPQKAYLRTLKRVLPRTSFDAVVNFNGYFPKAAVKLATGVQCNRKVIYLHNDLVEDLRIKHPQLHSVFSIYTLYDELFCVSKDSCEDNKRKISQYSLREFNLDLRAKFSYCMNPIVSLSIKERAEGGEEFLVNKEKYLLLDSEDGVAKGVRYSNKVINFISVGRLSAEKNHLRLINAFNLLHSGYPGVHLYIVGFGNMDGRLREEIACLGLEGKVTLTGFIKNPLKLVKKSDCFVLSSDIEGQPITVLEALTLNTPVIATNVAGPRGLLQEYGGVLVERDVGAIADAMRKFVKGDLACGGKDFDPEKYTRDAMSQFYKKVIKCDGAESSN